MERISINGKEYAFRYSIRALFIYEEIAGKPFEASTLLDQYMLFYSMILAANRDSAPSWDEFLDATDEDPSILQAMASYLTGYRRSRELLEAAEGDAQGEKKNAGSGTFTPSSSSGSA